MTCVFSAHLQILLSHVNGECKQCQSLGITYLNENTDLINIRPFHMLKRLIMAGRLANGCLTPFNETLAV